MRIKRLEVTGFKSFCDRTIVQFNDPITAVVGSLNWTMVRSQNDLNPVTSNRLIRMSPFAEEGPQRHVAQRMVTGGCHPSK